jgi:DNA-binding MarR family transcriptional regulator
MSHLIKRLEKRGWVRRELDPADGRYTNAILTEAGWAKVVATAPGHVETVRRLVVDVLTPAQLRQLGDLSDRLLRGMTPGDCPPGQDINRTADSADTRNTASPGPTAPGET